MEQSELEQRVGVLEQRLSEFLDRFEASPAPPSPDAYERRLRELRNSLVHEAPPVDADLLRDLLLRFAHGSTRFGATRAPLSADPRLAEVQEALRRFTDDLERAAYDMTQQDPASKVLERFRLLQPSFETLLRKWRDMRDSVGTAAADEVLEGADLKAGWNRRWASLADIAWARRESMLRAAEDNAGPRTGDGRANRLFAAVSEGAKLRALDLRYGADLPLAQIADFLNLSPAAIQLRIADFEEDVLRRFAERAIREQLPSEWQLSEEISPDDFGGELNYFVLEPKEEPGRAIVVCVLTAWEDGDGGAGRPRGAARDAVRRLAGFTPRLWAVAFARDTHVRFIPEAALPSGQAPDGSDRVRPQQVIEAARFRGFDSLGDAIGAMESGNQANDWPTRPTARRFRFNHEKPARKGGGAD